MDRDTSQNSICPDNSENDVLRYARHDVFTNSGHLSAAVRHLSLDLVQRGSGPFRGDLYSGALEGTMVQFIHSNQPTISRGINAPDRLAVLIQLRGSEPCIWSGYESQGSSVITYGPGHEHFGAEPKEFEYAFVSIPLERIDVLMERCHEATVGRLRTGCHRLQAPAVGFIEIEKHLTRLQAVIDSKPKLLAHAAIRQMFEIRWRNPYYPSSVRRSSVSLPGLHRSPYLGSNHPPNRTIFREPSGPANPFDGTLLSHRCKPNTARPCLS